MIAGAAGYGGDAADRPQVEIRDRQRHLVLHPAQIGTQGLGDDHRLLVDFLEHIVAVIALGDQFAGRSEEHTSELQSLMRISYAVFCLKKKKTNKPTIHTYKNSINK